jgi:hypothetical protein
VKDGLPGLTLHHALVVSTCCIPATPAPSPRSSHQALVYSTCSLIPHPFPFFPQALVYSTCSIHQVENERVVAAVLDANPHFELDLALPHWPRRGQILEGIPPSTAASIARCTVRTQYPDDATIGFFLARFVRRGSAHAAAGVASATGVSAGLAAKLDNLAKVRKKMQRARAAATGSSVQAGATAAVPSHPPPDAEAPCVVGGKRAGGDRAVPLWRIERDAKKQQKRKAISH